MNSPGVLLLGFGQAAKAVLAALPEQTKVYATTRQPLRLFELMDFAVEPIVMPTPSIEIIEPLARGNNVLVSFPPDGTADEALAPACREARSVVYISSTGVYGSVRGRITDETPPAAEEAATQPRLAAEEIWRSVGATILRAPGIYGPASGLHKRLRQGTYAIPGDGSRTISRVHVEDLAQFVLAVWERTLRGETYVVGDLAPAPHLEVAEWLCLQLGIPLPTFAPLDAVSPTLRGDRAIDPTRAIKDLAVALKYPTYKEGYEACLQASSTDAS